MDFLRSDIFMIVLVFGSYFGALELQRRLRSILLNPVLISILLIIGFLKLAGLSYDDFRPSGRLIEFWLKPAIVALAIPLYHNLKAIRRQFIPILLSQLAGCVVGIVSVVLIAKWLGASPQVMASLAPKSVTTPIAVEISAQIGGIPSLTAAIVVCVGLIGAILGMQMLRAGHVKSPIAQSLSMGTAAHVIGTNRVSEIGERYGAFATVGLILNGILTAVLAPLLLPLLI